MSDQAAIMLTRLSRLVAGEGHLHGLHPAQLQTLRFLAHANRFTRTPRGVTAWLGQTKGTVSQTLAALERKAFIMRRSDPVDRRVVRLELTPAGRAVLEASSDIAEQLTSMFDEAESAGFSATVEKMLRAHLAAGGYRMMGVCATCRHFEEAPNPGADHHCALLDVPLTETDSQLICLEQEAA
jgi:DNA-binding MarR family transcriptional regulator